MIIPRQSIQIAVGVTFLALGAFLKYKCISFPWAVCSVPYATFLIVLGTWLKHYTVVEDAKWYTLLLCFIITFVISHKWRLDMAWNQILPVSILTVGAVSGTFMVFILSSYISKYTSFISQVFQAIGKETFIILAFSQVLGPIVQFFMPCNKIIEYELMN